MAPVGVLLSASSWRLNLMRSLNFIARWKFNSDLEPIKINLIIIYPSFHFFIYFITRNVATQNLKKSYKKVTEGDKSWKGEWEGDLILTKFEFFLSSCWFIHVHSCSKFADSSSQHFFGNDIWKHFPIRIYSLLPHMLSKFTYVARLYQHQSLHVQRKIMTIWPYLT